MADDLQRLHFDRHLYQPLVLDHERHRRDRAASPEAERKGFVSDLKEYWGQEKDESLAGRQVFLLRNLSRGSGIGFFEERGFYPDFILWIMDGPIQRIVFIEPHGMLHEKPYRNDDKARLHEALPELAQEIAARSCPEACDAGFVHHLGHALQRSAQEV